MRLLGSNLLPFSVAQLPATWSTGIEVEAYFFEGDMPSDPSQYFFDQRKLIADCVAASRIVLQPTSDGLMFHQAYSHGIKAVAGSVYDPKLGVTIHYPNNIIPRRTTSSTTTMDIDAAYAIDLMTGNKKLKQHLSLAMFPGFPINAVRTLTDLIGNTNGQIATVCDLVFDGLRVFDGALSDSPDKSVASTLQIIAQGTASGATTVGTTVTLNVPVNLATNLSPTPISTDVLRCVGNASARRVLPVSVGDTSTTPVTKTIGHAILVIPDSNNGALSIGNYDIRLMVTKVGLKGSGELIEVDSVSLSTGDFAEVVQVRTAKVVGSTVVDTSWIAPNAVMAFDGLRFSSSPNTDYLGKAITFNSFITAQPDRSIKMAKGGALTFPKNSVTGFNPLQSFYIEFDYRQEDLSGLAEFTIFGQSNGLLDRLSIAFDRGNETGFCIWNNAQATKVARPLSLFTRMISANFVKVLYEYNSTTFLHKLTINGILADSFTYQILACTDTVATLNSGYSSGTYPIPFVRNFQIVTGTKS